MHLTLLKWYELEIDAGSHKPGTNQTTDGRGYVNNLDQVTIRVSCSEDHCWKSSTAHGTSRRQPTAAQPKLCHATVELGSALTNRTNMYQPTKCYSFHSFRLEWRVGFCWKRRRVSNEWRPLCHPFLWIGLIASLTVNFYCAAPGCSASGELVPPFPSIATSHSVFTLVLSTVQNPYPFIALPTGPPLSSGAWSDSPPAQWPWSCSDLRDRCGHGPRIIRQHTKP